MGLEYDQVEDWEVGSVEELVRMNMAWQVTASVFKVREGTPTD